MQNKHYFFFPFCEFQRTGRGGGGVKPVGPNSQLLPKICFWGSPNPARVFQSISQKINFIFCFAVLSLGTKISTLVTYKSKWKQRIESFVFSVKSNVFIFAYFEFQICILGPLHALLFMETHMFRSENESCCNLFKVFQS